MDTPRIPRRAKQILNRMLNNRMITPGGLNWLVAATDPFHDGPLEVTGYPDANQNNSLVQIVNRTVNIEKPAGHTGSWDAHIFFAPVTPSMTSLDGVGGISADYVRGKIHQDYFHWRQDDVITPQIQPGYNVITLGTGENWHEKASTGWESNNSLKFPNDYFAGQFRLIGAAVEVVNTTAALYQSGSVTAYRIPTAESHGTLHFNSSAPTVDHTTTFLTLPPGTQSQAILMPNTRVWSATKGLYSVSVQNDINNQLMTIGPKRSVAFTSPLMASDFQTLQALRTAWSHRTQTYSASGTKSKADATQFEFPVNSAFALPFDENGAIFSGLNENTTLQVSVKYLFERIPSYLETELAPLARTPPGYDPMIMEIYGRVMSELPVGCTVDENPLGEWFWDILKTVESIAPVIGTALAPMTGGASLAIGSGIAAAAGGARLLKPATSQQEKQAEREIRNEVKSEVRREMRKDIKKVMRPPVQVVVAKSNQNNRKRKAARRKALQKALKRNE